MNQNPNIIENNDLERNIDPKKMKTSMLIASGILSAVFAVVGCLFAFPVSLVFFAASAGHMAATFAAVKKPYGVVAIIPAMVVAVIYSLHYLIFLILLTIPLVAITVYVCISKQIKKSTTVIISSALLLLMFAVIFIVAIYSLYGGVNSEVFAQFAEDFDNMCRDLIDQLVANMSETIENIISQSGESVGEDSKEQIKALRDRVKQFRVSLEDSYRIMLYSSPAIIITVMNIFGYIAAWIAYGKAVTGACELTIPKEKAVLTIEVPGAVIFAVSFIVAIAVGVSTVPGLVCFNLFIIYLPALFIIGARTFLFEGVFKAGCLLVGFIGFALFINPVATVVMVAYLGAWTIIKKSITEFMSKKG